MEVGMKKLDTMHVCASANGASCAGAPPASGKLTLWSLLQQILVPGFDTLYTWQSRADERQHLRELEPRLLDDMGITEAEARAEAAKPFWRA
jgi:uncharacterized protein YjiS (DUF1127 family)